MLKTALLVALLPISAIAGTPAEIADRAAASVHRSSKWERIEVQRATADDYALVLWYRQMPASHAEVDRDTKAVGRAVLRELVAEKRLPSTTPLYLVVRGRMPAKGETGAQLVRVFGTNRYFSGDDQFTFERNK